MITKCFAMFVDVIDFEQCFGFFASLLVRSGRHGGVALDDRVVAQQSNECVVVDRVVVQRIKQRRA